VVAVVIVIHILVSLGLIGAILLHRGRGYGMSSAIGGVPSTFSGSSLIERNLDRLTIILAVIFAITTIALVIIFRV